MDKKTKSLRPIKASNFHKSFSKYDIKKYWKYFISFLLAWLLNQQNKEIGVSRIGDVIIDLCENNSGYYGTIFVDNYIWEFNGLKDSAIGIHNEYEIAEIACGFGGYYNSCNRGDDVPDWAPNAEIADAILRSSWWAEEVIELKELPDWCLYLKYAMF